MSLLYPYLSGCIKSMASVSVSIMWFVMTLSYWTTSSQILNLMTAKKFTIEVNQSEFKFLKVVNGNMHLSFYYPRNVFSLFFQHGGGGRGR